MPGSSAIFAVDGDSEALHLCRLGLAALGHRAALPPQLVVRPPGSAALRRVALGEEAAGPTVVGRVGPGSLRVAAYRDGPVALALDGAIPDGPRLRAELLEQGLLLGEEGDGEWILQTMAASDQRTFVNRLVDALSRLEAGFALVAVDSHRMVACRDPWGLRPLCLGRWKAGFLVASEGAAIHAMGGEWLRELLPGEMLILEEGRLEAIRPLPRRHRRACSVEILRLGRSESTIAELEVYAARTRLGECLARQHPCRADVVVPLPGAEPAALAFARRLGIPMEMPFRPGADRYVSARSLVAGRRVALVDLAMVRERPVHAAVRSLRASGAAEVHVRIGGPVVIAPCLYGVTLESEGRWEA